jgi:hypothetical protein
MRCARSKFSCGLVVLLLMDATFSLDGGQVEARSSASSPTDRSGKGAGPWAIAGAVPGAPRIGLADAPKPIIVRVEYFASRGWCIRGADGSIAMPVMDSFRVLALIRGRLEADQIFVRPGSRPGPLYPSGLARGEILTIRLNLSDDTWKRAEGLKARDSRTLVVDGEEVERIDES